MPMLRNVLGLDAGTHSLKAVELQQNLRGFEAVQQRSRVRPDPGAPTAPLLSEFVELHDFDTDYVVAAIPGDSLSTRTVSFPIRERRKLAQHWSAAGQAEHASVAAFSRFATEMLALGAPAGLVAEATRAMADEINHARLCFGIASAAAGTQMSVGGIDVAGSLDEVTAERVLVDTILEGCINETICAAQAEAALAQTTDPTIRAALSQIVEDEQRHATLAWKTIRWILETRPDLHDLAQQTFAEAISGPTPTCSQADDSVLASHGIPAMSDDQKTAKKVLADVIEPCARALLQKEAQGRGAVA